MPSMHPDLPFAQRTLDWAHSRGICVHLLFGFVMGDKYGCCVGERMAGFLPMSLTTSVAIPMDVAPRTQRTTRARVAVDCPRRKARHCVWRGGWWRGGWLHWQRQVAIRRFSQDKQALGPDQEHTHTGQPEHTGEGARSPLCCRFTWGLLWLVVLRFGRQTRV